MSRDAAYGFMITQDGDRFLLVIINRIAAGSVDLTGLPEGATERAFSSEAAAMSAAQSHLFDKDEQLDWT